MPTLTVRALAEFAAKPVNDQMRILALQKRPTAEPAAFRIPYYKAAQTVIRNHFRASNRPDVVVDAIESLANTHAETANAEHRLKNNIRALNSFRRHDFSKRTFVVDAQKGFVVNLHGVSVKVTPDLVAAKGSLRTGYFINFNQAAVPDAEARLTLELAIWLAARSSVHDGFAGFEFVDLANGKSHPSPKSVRKTSSRNAELNLTVINQLWPIV